ncbi:hypothetical protein ACIQ2D_20970 [Lysinibacillus sp. NPDC097287]|uniref:hypothetical protein n=1 Tax=Lysinibacillus sp. NPDC097287 TaxID=3364144 RepID=UPI003808381D
MIKGEIDFDEYLKKRNIHRTEKLNELRHIFNEKPTLFNLYLAKVSITIRVMAMKVIFDFTNEELGRIVKSSGTTIGEFIKQNNVRNINKNVYKQRNFLPELIYNLSIVLDLPHRYLADTNAEYKMINSFVEYDRTTIESKSLFELVDEIITKMKNSLDFRRTIYGVKVENDFFKFEKSFLNTRVDIREKFFTVEIHIENEASIEYSALFILESSLKVKSEMFIRKAILRENNKLYILIPLDDSFKPDILHLQERFLWRNLLLPQIK